MWRFDDVNAQDVCALVAGSEAQCIHLDCGPHQVHDKVSAAKGGVWRGAWWESELLQAGLEKIIRWLEIFSRQLEL